MKYKKQKSIKIKLNKIKINKNKIYENKLNRLLNFSSKKIFNKELKKLRNTKNKNKYLKENIKRLEQINNKEQRNFKKLINEWNEESNYTIAGFNKLGRNFRKMLNYNLSYEEKNKVDKILNKYTDNDIGKIMKGISNYYDIEVKEFFESSPDEDIETIEQRRKQKIQLKESIKMIAYNLPENDKNELITIIRNL